MLDIRGFAAQTALCFLPEFFSLEALVAMEKSAVSKL
jgi:hypothetical protein